MTWPFPYHQVRQAEPQQPPWSHTCLQLKEKVRQQGATVCCLKQDLSRQIFTSSHEQLICLFKHLQKFEKAVQIIYIGKYKGRFSVTVFN